MVRICTEGTLEGPTVALTHQTDHHTGAGQRRRLAAFLFLGPCRCKRTGVVHVVPGGGDPAVGTLDVGDAELPDMAVEGIGDGGYVPCITLTGSGVRRAQARLADRRGEHRPGPV
jgi:hypothetical protein